MDKAEAKKLVVKARMYRFFAVMFAFIALLNIVYIYKHKGDGSFLTILKDWLTIVVIVSPFLPALIFGMIAKKAEAKLDNFLSSLDK